MAGHGIAMGKKEKFDSASFVKVIKSAKRYYPLIIISTIFAIGAAVCTIIGPDKIQDLVKIITKGIPTQTNPFVTIDLAEFARLATTLVIIYIVGALLGYAQQYIMAEVTQRTSKKLRAEISLKINKLPLKYFDTTTKGDILSRVTNDVDTISQTLGSNIANLLNAIVLFFGVLVMMFKTNYILSFVTIGTSIIGFVAMSFIVVKSQKHFNNRQKFIGDVNGSSEETFTNFKVIKSYNSVDTESVRFNSHVDDLYHATWRANFLSGLMMPIMVFTGNLAYALIFIVGILTKGMSGIDMLGTLAAFAIYSKLFSQPLSTFAQSINQLQQCSAAGKRVFELLEEKEILDESKKDTKLTKVRGDVEFRNVRFAYDPNKVIIKNFTAKLKAGQKVAIVGPTGAGKTTMVNLLMRFYEIMTPRFIINNKITDYKVFIEGHSVKFKFDNDGYLFIDGINTNNKFNDNKYPKNIDLSFNQFFEINGTKNKLPLVTGNDLDNIKDIPLGIAYYGDIFIDSVPIKALTRNNIHDLFDMILQDTWLFNGTIKENLIYNKNSVSEDKLNEVCNAVGLTHFVDTLPNRYETVLGDVDSLSEGQKQQLTIARAMIKDSPLLILDEATSNVDTRTELVIQEAMDRLTKGRTSFVIAHRLSTIKNADVILVMRDGDIVEVGNHNELLSKNGFYASLYNSQFVKI